MTLRSLYLVCAVATSAACFACYPLPALANSAPTSTVRGIVRAVNQASMSIDLPVRVAKLHFREAQAFAKGDTLITFDCERLLAEQAAAAAQSREMKLTLESQSYLETRGAAGKLDVQISRARADKAEAEAAGIAARLKQCRLIAPYDGRITELKVNEHEVPPSGQPFISIVDETNFEIDMILPSKALRSVREGMPLQFLIDETGTSYEATVARIGASVDAVSQTVKVIATFTAADRRVIVGMSGSAAFPIQQAAQ